MRLFIIQFLCGLLSCLYTASSTFAAPPTRILQNHLAAGAIAMSPDGRIAITLHTINFQKVWKLQVVRPETIQKDSQGLPIFFDSFVSSGTIINRSEAEIEYVSGVDGFPVPTRYIEVPHAMALGIHPSLPEQKFRSDAAGNPDSNGYFHTYKFILYDGNIAWVRMQMRELTVIVRAPETIAAEVESFSLSNPIQISTPEGLPIIGFEPTTTADGRMIVFHGFARDGDVTKSSGDRATLEDCITRTGDSDLVSIVPGSTAAQAKPCAPAGNGSINGYLFYTVNENPLNPNGWSIPKDLTKLFEDRDLPFLNGTFKDYFPIAKKPLLEIDGSPVLAPYAGAYPWITMDGTEIIHTTILAGLKNAEINSVAVRGGEAIIGDWTGSRLRYLDGPINPTRWNSDNNSPRLFFASPGMLPSMWPVFGKQSQLLPYTDRDSALILFGANSKDYTEISFDEYRDGDYLTYLPMNESLKRLFRDNGKPANRWRIDIKTSPDISGNGNNAILSSGAKFTYEQLSGVNSSDAFLRDAPTGVNSSFDVTSGINGEAIHFSKTGYVHVPKNSSFDYLKDQFGIETFIKFTDKFVSSDSIGVAALSGVFSVSIENKNVVANVVGFNGSTCTVSYPIEISQSWKHLSLDASAQSKKVRLFFQGQLVAEKQCELSAFKAAGDFKVGPGSVPFGGGNADSIAVFDEVGLKTNIYSDLELSRRAFLRDDNSSPSTSSSAVLPLGLEDAHIANSEESIVRKDLADIGEKIFFDKRLSADGQVSCGSCHIPEKSFTDGLRLARGVFGREGIRNTPTLVNRFLGAHQNFDGKASTIKDQLVLPIQHEKEMAITLSEFVNKVSQDTVNNYSEKFRQIGFQAVDQDTISEALAQFVRSISSGSSPFDNFIRGNSNSISESAKRGFKLFNGKARCIACHAGPNFTDENFHATGLIQLNGDLGRFHVTGRESDKGKFKTPTLRDIALTAPYFHDGSVATLDEVLTLYNQRSIAGEPIGREMRPLGLSQQELNDIKEFLLSLTGADPIPTSDKSALVHLETQVSRSHVGPGEGIFITARYLKTVGDNRTFRLRSTDPLNFPGAIASEFGSNGEVLFRGWIKAPQKPGEFNLKLYPTDTMHRAVGDATAAKKILVSIEQTQDRGCVESELMKLLLLVQPNPSASTLNYFRSTIADEYVKALSPNHLLELRRHAAREALKSDALFLKLATLSYQIILSRTPSQSELVQSGAALKIKKDGLLSFMRSLARSHEFVTKAISGLTSDTIAWKPLVSAVYLQFLNRTPSTQEFSDAEILWKQGKVKANITVGEIQTLIANSTWGASPEAARFMAIAARVMETHEFLTRIEPAFRQILSNLTNKSFNPVLDFSRISTQGLESIFDDLLIQTPFMCSRSYPEPSLEEDPAPFDDDPLPPPAIEPTSTPSGIKPRDIVAGSFSVGVTGCDKKGGCFLTIIANGLSENSLKLSQTRSKKVIFNKQIALRVSGEKKIAKVRISLRKSDLITIKASKSAERFKVQSSRSLRKFEVRRVS